MEIKRKIKFYESMLTVCCVCKRIRADKNSNKENQRWVSVEEYMQENVHMEITSIYCPECEEKMRRSKSKTA